MSHGVTFGEVLTDEDFIAPTGEHWPVFGSSGEGWSDAAGFWITRVALASAERPSGPINEIVRLSKEVNDLKARVEQLEKIVSEEDGSEPIVDANLNWCIDHRDLFAGLPRNSFVAVNVSKGNILIYDVDQIAFSNKLAQLANADADSIYVTNVSEFM